MVFLENPQRGSAGVPFINKTTLLWVINRPRRAFNSCAVSSFSDVGASAKAGEAAGEAVVLESGVTSGRLA